MQKLIEKIVLRESARLAKHNNNIICGECNEEQVRETKSHISSLGIEFNVNMQKINGSLFFHPVSIDATYQGRSTVVRYCLATRMTTRFSSNGNAVYFKKHSVIEFMEYAKNLFLGKDKVKCKHLKNVNVVKDKSSKSKV